MLDAYGGNQAVCGVADRYVSGTKGTIDAGRPQMDPTRQVKVDQVVRMRRIAAKSPSQFTVPLSSRRRFWRSLRTNSRNARSTGAFMTPSPVALRPAAMRCSSISMFVRFMLSSLPGIHAHNMASPCVPRGEGLRVLRRKQSPLRSGQPQRLTKVRTFLTCSLRDQLTDLRHQFLRDLHHGERNVLVCCLVLGDGFLLCLFLVVVQDSVNTLLIPPWRKFAFLHLFPFLRSRRRKAINAFPVKSYAVITNMLSGSGSGT